MSNVMYFKIIVEYFYLRGRKDFSLRENHLYTTIFVLITYIGVLKQNKETGLSYFSNDYTSPRRNPSSRTFSAKHEVMDNEKLIILSKTKLCTMEIY